MSSRGDQIPYFQIVQIIGGEEEVEEEVKEESEEVAEEDAVE